MFTHEVKQLVFRGTLQPSAKPAGGGQDNAGIHLCRDADKPTHYSILSQSRHDLDDPENSPSISMWPYLLASAQTQRLNEISVYVEHGLTADTMRYLYMNDFALGIWGEMKKNTEVLSRLHRPPRGAVLSFGMPFSE